jgi:hypothetical protein
MLAVLGSSPVPKSEKVVLHIDENAVSRDLEATNWTDNKTEPHSCLEVAGCAENKLEPQVLQGSIRISVAALRFTQASLEF